MWTRRACGTFLLQKSIFRECSALRLKSKAKTLQPLKEKEKVNADKRIISKGVSGDWSRLHYFTASIACPQCTQLTNTSFFAAQVGLCDAKKRARTASLVAESWSWLASRRPLRTVDILKQNKKNIHQHKHWKQESRLPFWETCKYTHTQKIYCVPNNTLCSFQN